MEAERKKRTYIHKGKVRIGCRRLPRKLKKKWNKRVDKEINGYFSYLKEIHSDAWAEHIIYGG